MHVQSVLFFVDSISTWVGKAFAWLMVLLTLVICYDVFMRYVMNDPTLWVYDTSYMIYGSLFMMCGAYTLAQDGHVRGDFLYGSMQPRTQAALDLVLYAVFFVPGIAALCYAGIDFAEYSWFLRERSSVTPNGPPLYHFKTVIPIAGALVMLQGLAEIVRCVVCLKTGHWPERLKDAEEIDVIEQQLAGSTLVDDESRQRAIAQAHAIDEAAHQRGMGDRAMQDQPREPDPGERK
jgi:TRAP-type mannitol/chloroaromatic compound transport system permease small subunit